MDLVLDVGTQDRVLSDRGNPPYVNSISHINLVSTKGLGKLILVKKLHEAIALAVDLEN